MDEPIDPAKALRVEWANSLKEQFDIRAKAQNYGPKSKTYAKLYLEFLVGAMALAEAQKDDTLTSIIGIRAMLASVGRID